jgi:hypothetical protein
MHVISRLVTTMCIMAFPPHLGRDLFPRVLGAVNLLDTYKEHIRFISADDRIAVSSFLVFAGYLLHHEPGAAVYMCKEPGFYHLIGRSFPCVFDPPFLSMKETLVGNVCVFLQDVISDGDSSLFEEFVAGAGSSANFAVHLVRYLSSLLEPSKMLSPMDTRFLQRAIWLVVHVEIKNPGDPASVITRVSTALRENGIIGPVAHAALFLAENHGVFLLAGPLLETALSIIAMIFSDVYGHQWIPCAIEHNLLRAIISASQLPPGQSLHDHLQCLITLMSQTTVYSRVLVAFAAALPTLMALTSSTAFRSTIIYPAWSDLTRLVEQR